MDPKIRDFQAKSLPLGRFAEVDIFYFILFKYLVNNQPTCSLTRWVDKHSFYSPNTPPTWRVVNILLMGKFTLFPLSKKVFSYHFYSAGIWFGKRHKRSKGL